MDPSVAKITSAAIQYHGKTHPPRQMDHPCELDVVVSTSDRGILSPSAYEVKNVTGKLIADGDDMLVYSITFREGHSPRLDIVTCVKVAPRVTPRRQGRAECGFTVALPDHDLYSLTAPFYVSNDGYSLVVSQKTPSDLKMVAQIFFTLEDVNFTPDPPPLWRLSADDSGIMSQHNPAWVPLPPVHPDPRVDPGVPIECRPQRSPGWFWFRNDCAHPQIFKGKISGSRLYKFLGGGYSAMDFLRDTGFKGNDATRFGRTWEAVVTLMYLNSCDKDVQMFECGTYMHPRLPDVCAAPDARIKDPSRTFAKLPAWYRKEVAQYETTVDWSMGVFECKTMLRRNKALEGPELKPDHLAQMYLEMMCTGSHWGELIRYCHETGEARIFRVYRKPGLAERIEKCIARMCKEMIAGTPYPIVIQHESNIEIINDLRAQAAYYNEPGATPQRYRLLHRDDAMVEKYNKDVTSRDLVASTPDSPALPTVIELNEQKIKNVAPGKTKTKKSAAPKKTQDETNDAGKRPRCDVDADDEEDWRARWKVIQAQNKVISACFRNGDWEVASDQNVFKAQIVRLMELETDIAIGIDRKRRRPDPIIVMEADQ